MELLSIQDQIQLKMEELAEDKRWEFITLFSSEGLPMASYGQSTLYDQDELLEFSYKLIEILPLLKECLPVQHILIDSNQGKAMVFRFLTINSMQLTLAAIVDKHTACRRNLNRLIQYINDLLS